MTAATAVLVTDLGNLNRRSVLAVAVDRLQTLRVINVFTLSLATIGGPVAGIGSGGHLVGFVKEGAGAGAVEGDQTEGAKCGDTGSDYNDVDFQGVPQQVLR